MKNILKTVIAGICAVAVLSLIVIPYSFSAAHIANPLQNTDYTGVPNSYWSTMREGISHGKKDANGYNNLQVIQSPDIITLGSSHIEAYNVMQEESTSYLLGQRLQGSYSVYNMGVSGHNLYKVCKYLPRNLELFPDAKVVIIETDSVELKAEKVEQIFNNTVPFTPSRNTGIVALLQKCPFFRLMYHQLDGGLIDLMLPEKATKASKEPNKQETDLQTYQRLFSYLNSLQQESETKLIIFFHPFEVFNEDGSISFKTDLKQLEMFAACAAENEITFVDMTEEFETMYYENHHVPHGFITGEIGAGHLNKYGHAAIADALTEVIHTLEEEGKICR